MRYPVTAGTKFAAHPCASVIYDHTKTGHPGLQTVLIPWLQKLGSAAASIARSSWVRGTGCIVFNKRRG